MLRVQLQEKATHTNLFKSFFSFSSFFPPPPSPPTPPRSSRPPFFLYKNECPKTQRSRCLFKNNSNQAPPKHASKSNMFCWHQQISRFSNPRHNCARLLSLVPPLKVLLCRGPFLKRSAHDLNKIQMKGQKLFSDQTAWCWWFRLQQSGTEVRAIMRAHVRH